ncbi:metal ABC transporter ATP-binding protein [Aestuariimicrobium soli]|uniref:metal ABC transporter ATP-binding protein n=1 Tax=Aestuariimicrobium soli TaxID=2035834 RepID=UPI003EB73353
MTAPTTPDDAPPAICLNNACVAFGDRVLWDHVDLDIAPGEFVAILGPNGAGKTTLLRVLLGQQELAHGRVEIDGEPVQRGSRRIGYVPQQKTIDSTAVIRGRDLVALGLDGDRWGITWPSRSRRAKVDWALEAVGATAYADAPLSMLSGGEQQRLRIAQALVTDPSVLLCDEPLLSLDIKHQHQVTDLIDRTRREHTIAVLFVTHEINPVLPLVDRIIYFANGQALIGTPDEVMTTETLSELYGRKVEVLRHDGQLLVFGGDEHAHHPDHDEPVDA